MQFAYFLSVGSINEEREKERNREREREREPARKSGDREKGERDEVLPTQNTPKNILTSTPKCSSIVCILLLKIDFGSTNESSLQAA